MKTLTTTTALLITLTVLLSVNLTASVYNFSDEPYINDITFNTECISIVCLYQQAISVDFELEDEQYINDIPFDTKCVAADCLYRRAMKVEFNFEEEEYIDNIDF